MENVRSNVEQAKEKFYKEKKLNISLKNLFSLDRYVSENSDGTYSVAYTRLLDLDTNPRINPVIEKCYDIGFKGYYVDAIQVEDLSTNERNLMQIKWPSDCCPLYLGVENPKSVSSLTNMVIVCGGNIHKLPIPALSMLRIDEYVKFVEKASTITITIFYIKKE